MEEFSDVEVTINPNSKLAVCASHIDSIDDTASELFFNTINATDFDCPDNIDVALGKACVYTYIRGGNKLDTNTVIDMIISSDTENINDIDKLLYEIDTDYLIEFIGLMGATQLSDASIHLLTELMTSPTLHTAIEESDDELFRIYGVAMFNELIILAITNIMNEDNGVGSRFTGSPLFTTVDDGADVYIDTMYHYYGRLNTSNQMTFMNNEYLYGNTVGSPTISLFEYGLAYRSMQKEIIKAMK